METGAQEYWGACCWCTNIHTGVVKVVFFFFFCSFLNDLRLEGKDRSSSIKEGALMLSAAACCLVNSLMPRQQAALQGMRGRDRSPVSFDGNARKSQFSA